MSIYTHTLGNIDKLEGQKKKKKSVTVDAKEIVFASYRFGRLGLIRLVNG